MRTPLKLKPAVASVMEDGDEAGRVIDALTDLSKTVQDAKVHWRVRQLANALCEKPGSEYQDEP